MLNKKILAAAIAATFTTSAIAVVDLDASPVVPAKYAAETVAASTTTTDGAREITDAATNLSVDANVGFGFTANTSFYVRYDLTGAVWETALTNNDLVLTGTAPVETLSQGGAEDDTFVIYEVVDTAAVSTTGNLQLAVADMALTGTGDSSVRFRVFANAPDAVNGTNALVDKSGTHVDQVNAITTEFSATNLTADVAGGFLAFTAGTEAAVGSVELTLATAFAADDGAAVTRADVITDATSVFSVTGDFSTMLTDSDGGVTLDTSSTCANAGTSLTVAEDGGSASVTGTATFADATEIFVCLEPDTDTAIAATDAFVALIDVTAGSDGTYADQTGNLGAISRNGTTLEIPYITTFSDYNQRLLITNNASTATSYTCTFTPEDGVTAVAGDGATGDIAGNTTVSVRATDLVTLTGGNRTAARCSLLSQSTNIDAATTIVNLSDKSTDTVTIN